MEVAVAAAEEKEVAVASAGAQTGGVEETGEREKSSCGEDGRMDKVGWVDKVGCWAFLMGLSLTLGPQFSYFFPFIKVIHI